VYGVVSKAAIGQWRSDFAENSVLKFYSSGVERRSKHDKPTYFKNGIN
jgi:hypothetical protein